MSVLLDVSTLLALLWENHIHHPRVRNWELHQEISICPITELGFLRISTLAFHADMKDARASLSTWLNQRRPSFLPCDTRVLDGVGAPVGGKTTDYYLANLAQAHSMMLATLDEQIGHPSAFVIPR